MPPGHYKSPPITEAVIDVQFADACELKDLERVQQRLRDRYPSVESSFEISVTFGPEGDAVSRQHTGYKIASADQVDVVLLSLKSFTISRLAPYCGWEKLRATFMQNWDQYKSIVGYRRISRIGMRYINRLDIPVDNTPVVNRADYLTFGVVTPDAVPGPLGKYSAQTVSEVANLSGILVVTTATMQSPLVGHVSILLDIDVYRDQNVPQRDEEVIGLVESFRDFKNTIFEACVADGARRLFDNG